MLEEFRIQCDEFSAHVMREDGKLTRLKLETKVQIPENNSTMFLKVRHGEISEYSVENQEWGVFLLFSPEGKEVCHKYISKVPTIKSPHITQEMKATIDEVFDTNQELTLKTLQDELVERIKSKKIKLKFTSIKK